jgi:hypothetical protein
MNEKKRWLITKLYLKWVEECELVELLTGHVLMLVGVFIVLAIIRGIQWLILDIV